MDKEVSSRFRAAQHVTVTPFEENLMSVFKETSVMRSEMHLQRTARPLWEGSGAGGGWWIEELFSAESSPAP